MKNGYLCWTLHGRKHWLISGRFEQGQQMLALPLEQAPLTDRDPNSSSHKLGSVSEVLQDFFLWEPYYKWHSTRLLLDPTTSRGSGRLAEDFGSFFPHCIQHTFAFTFAVGHRVCSCIQQTQIIPVLQVLLHKAFSLFPGKMEGWLGLWKSRYPISDGSYSGVLNLSVSMLLMFYFTCMIYVINCTASLLCYEDFY